jgi:hypothetical protein
VIWDLFQAYQISQLEKRIDSAQGGISEEQLRKKIVEVDVRDGQADGRMTPRAQKCPKCEAMMSPQFGRCLFCGYKDPNASSL